MKKILSMILCVVFILSLMTGCGSKEEAKVKDASNIASIKTTNDATEQGKEDWEIDKSPLTITWFVEGDWYNKEWDVKNNSFDKMVTEDTGITVDVSSGNTEKLSALIASATLPDVITASYVLPQTQMLQKSGQVLSLDELAMEYAPNFKIPETMIKWHGKEDGHLYGFLNYFYDTDKLKEGEAVPTHVEMMARKEMMDKLNITDDDFNTKESTLNALRKVKEADLKYNGFDVVPCYFDAGNITEMFGASREDKDGNLLDKVYEKESLEAFKFLNQLVREELMPADAVTLTSKQKIATVQQGVVFAFTNHLLAEKVNELHAVDKSAYYVGVGPVKGDEEKPQYFHPSPMAGWTASMINRDAKKPERIIRFFEYLYHSDEMHLNVRYGVKGITWDFDENGRVKLLDEYKKEKEADPSKASLKYDSKFGWFVDWIPIMRAWPEPTTIQEKEHTASDEKYGKYWYNDLPFSTLFPELGTEIGIINTKIDENREKYFAKMILAEKEEDVEVLFNEMIKEDKALGYDKLYEWQNKQFKEAKKKLGVEYAWPSNK